VVVKERTAAWVRRTPVFAFFLTGDVIAGAAAIAGAAGYLWATRGRVHPGPAATGPGDHPLPASALLADGARS
jgi:hypothetical protein